MNQSVQFIKIKNVLFKVSDITYIENKLECIQVYYSKDKIRRFYLNSPAILNETFNSIQRALNIVTEF